MKMCKAFKSELYPILFMSLLSGLEIVCLPLTVKGIEPAEHMAEHQHAMLVVTSGQRSSQAGIQSLQQGGNAADAAVTTSLMQVVECAGCYVSAAGIFTMIYYDAETKQTHYLDAGFNTVAAETDPLTIPQSSPGGRTALVPGFMAGLDAALQRFGKLPRDSVVQPAIELAEKGFTIDTRMNRFLQARRHVLNRLEHTRSIFTKPSGQMVGFGDLLRQPELAGTLRSYASHGKKFFYTGQWAKDFVASVRKEGGLVEASDLANYEPTWQAPLTAHYRDYEVAVPGLACGGGVRMVEALNIMELAKLREQGHFAESADSFSKLAKFGHVHGLMLQSPSFVESVFGGPVSPSERIAKDSAKRIWNHLEHDPIAAPNTQPLKDQPTDHSDGVVVIDQWGNIAVVTHTINSLLWGDTGLFVGGISIPDAAALQPYAIKNAGRGNRLPAPTCPLIVFHEGEPRLGSSTIGSGLHPLTLQILANYLEFGRGITAASSKPFFLRSEYGATTITDYVIEGEFDNSLLQQVRERGLQVEELTKLNATNRQGYWIGIEIEPTTKLLRAGASDHQSAKAVGY